MRWYCRKPDQLAGCPGRCKSELKIGLVPICAKNADDAMEIGERLGVDSVFQGKLERVGEQIVISASLVDARDGSQIWGERLMRPDSELLYLERNIVDAITAGLKIKVTDSGSKLAASGGTDNPEAYEKYLRGHFLIQATEAGSIDQGLEELRAAIRLDPGFGLPYADIADALVQKIYYAIERSPELVGEARTAALSAVALAPDSAEAHTALAGVYAYFDFDWVAAEQAFEKAIALNPNSPVPYHRYSDFSVADPAHYTGAGNGLQGGGTRIRLTQVLYMRWACHT